MSDLFARLAQRALGVAPAVRPVVPPLWSGFPTFEDAAIPTEPIAPAPGVERPREVPATPASRPAALRDLVVAQETRGDAPREVIERVARRDADAAVARAHEATSTPGETLVERERTVEVVRSERLVALPAREPAPLHPLAPARRPEPLLPGLPRAAAERREPLRPDTAVSAARTASPPTPEPPQVHVSIGRIEVRATPKHNAPGQRRPRAAEAVEDRSRLTLREYLASGGERP